MSKIMVKKLYTPMSHYGAWFTWCAEHSWGMACGSWEKAMIWAIIHARSLH